MRGWSVFIVLISCFLWIIYVGIEKSYVYRLGLSRDDIINSFLLTKTIAMLNNRQLFSLEYVCVNLGLSLTSVLELGVCWRVHGFALHKHGGPAKCMQTGATVITEQWEGDAGQLYQCKYRRWWPPTPLPDCDEMLPHSFRIRNYRNTISSTNSFILKTVESGFPHVSKLFFNQHWNKR